MHFNWVSLGVVALVAIVVLMFGERFEKVVKTIDEFVEILLQPLVWILGPLHINADLLTTIRGVGSLSLILWTMLGGEHINVKFMMISGAILALTDKLDGMKARKEGTSKYGTIADPIADKSLVVAYSLRYITHSLYIGITLALTYGAYLWTVVAFVAYYFWSKLSLDRVIDLFKSNRLGKAKTFLQILAIANLYYLEVERSSSFTTWQNSFLLLWIALGLELKSQTKKANQLFDQKNQSNGQKIQMIR